MNERAGVRTVSRVAFLLGLQGAGELCVAFFGALTLPIQFYYGSKQGHALSNLDAVVLFAWLLASAVTGLVTLRAARENRRYRRRKLGQIALILGPLFCLFGLPILLYGLISYRSEPVRRVFELGEGGASEWQVEHE